MRSFTYARPSLFLLLLLLVCGSGLGLTLSSRGVAQAAGPQVWLSQKVVPPTASVQVHGTGFGPDETVLVAFDDTTSIGSTTTDATGGFVVRVMVPKTALPRTHSVRATGQSSGLTALALFLVRTDWAQLGFGPYQTGHNPYENVLSPSNVSALTLDWSHPNTDTSPVVADGMVYAGSKNKLDALDAVTGTLRWSYTTGRSIFYSPSVANGVVYVGSYDHKLYALDAVTGTLRWSYTTEGGIVSSPTIANGVVYVCSFKIYNNTLYALDAATGTLKWSNQADCGSTTVVNSVVYYGYLGNGTNGNPLNLYLDAVDAATGTLKWSYNTGSSTFANPSLAVANGVVYFGIDENPELYAVDAATGILKWSYNTGYTGYAVVSAIANGVVYVCSNSLDALDAVTGTLKWSYAGGCYGSSPAVVNGMVYFGGGNGLLAFHLPGMS